ncbi:MAG: 40S ribosomal protein S2 [Amphiamblys sp. WSBS2006]|nr:MAG: 40S ribosomal protein S2 [Amphiamblys sp. WSBS2006]
MEKGQQTPTEQKRERPGKGGRGKRDVPQEKEWVPITKLGRLVKSGKITLEEIYHHSIPIKEYQIIDFFIPELKEEVMKIASVQKQSKAGQQTRYKAVVIVGDAKGHVGFGVKCSKEVASAIRGAVIAAKLSLIPVRLGFWGTAFKEPHTVPVKTSGKCGSVTVDLIPAPRGTGVVAAPVCRKLLEFAGVKDCYTNSRGTTRTAQNFLHACFIALQKSLEFLTPDQWEKTVAEKSPMDVIRLE